MPTAAGLEQIYPSRVPGSVRHDLLQRQNRSSSSACPEKTIYWWEPTASRMRWPRRVTASGRVTSLRVARVERDGDLRVPAFAHAGREGSAGTNSGLCLSSMGERPARATFDKFGDASRKDARASSTGARDACPTMFRAGRPGPAADSYADRLRSRAREENGSGRGTRWASVQLVSRR